jgi:hypothetical protein
MVIASREFVSTTGKKIEVNLLMVEKYFRKIIVK